MKEWSAVTTQVSSFSMLMTNATFVEPDINMVNLGYVINSTTHFKSQSGTQLLISLVLKKERKMSSGKSLHLGTIVGSLLL
jgi:uncharacterized membrane protein YoaK (UPF0700 family)